MKIEKYFNEPTEFIFLEVTPNDIKKEIKNLRSPKKVRFKNITTKSFKEAPDICSLLLQTGYGLNKLYEQCAKGLKNADVTPVYKKDSPVLAKKVNK